MKLLAIIFMRGSDTTDAILERSKDDPLWLRVCDLHYHTNLTQKELASLVKCNQSYVSNMLSKIINEEDVNSLWGRDIDNKDIESTVREHIIHNEYKSVEDIVSVVVCDNYTDKEEQDIALSIVKKQYWYVELCRDFDKSKIVCKRCNRNSLEVDIGDDSYCDSCRDIIDKEIVDDLKSKADKEERRRKDIEETNKRIRIEKIRVAEQRAQQLKEQCELRKKMKETETHRREQRNELITNIIRIRVMYDHMTDTTFDDDVFHYEIDHFDRTGLESLSLDKLNDEMTKANEINDKYQLTTYRYHPLDELISSFSELWSDPRTKIITIICFVILIYFIVVGQ